MHPGFDLMHTLTLTGVVDIAALFSALWQGALVAAGFFIILAILISRLQYEVLEDKAEKQSGDLAPIDAFRIRSSKFLATMHRDPDPFCLVSLRRTPNQGEQLTEEENQELDAALLKRLADEVRKGDVLMAYQPGVIGLVTPLKREKLPVLLERLLRDALTESTALQTGRRITLKAICGVVSYPENGANIDALIEASASAMQTAANEQLDVFFAPATAPVPEVVPQEPSSEPLQKPEDDEVLDPLTGVLRADLLGPAVQKFVGGHRKESQSVSLIYLDIDGLDRYNEHYGQEAGDALLRGLGQLLTQSVREDDLIGRVENDEFLIAMACHPAGAAKAATRLSNLIKKTPMVYLNNKLRITVSMGIAGHPDHGGSARILYERAELAMYGAKALGRGMVATYEKHMRMPTANTAVRRQSVDAF